MKINKDLIKTLSEYLEEFKLTSLSYKDGDISIKVGKEAKATAVASAPLQLLLKRPLHPTNQ